jgi:hypothetical protein
MLTEKTLIWSKGYLNNNYSKRNSEDSSNETEIVSLINNNDGIIFIRNGSNAIDLYIFAQNIHKLSKPCILITSDGVRPVPSSYNINICNIILENLNIKKWYTQNYDKSIIHNKLCHYPIGFDLHTNQWLVNNSISDKINFMINCRQNHETNKRISNKIYSDTHHSISHPIRTEIYNLIKNNSMFKLSNKIESFMYITYNYNKYNFVLSPRGRGVDCHRTWELFLAGVIVITLTSPLDEMYINNNLPVVILQNLNELNNITQDKLNKWYKLHIDKTDINNIFPRLTYNYWIK